MELQQTAGLPQVFYFSRSFVTYNALPYFVASTHEGLLRLGKIDSDKLRVLGKTTIAPEGGAALSVHPSTQEVAAVAFDIGLFTTRIGYKTLTT